MVDGERDPHQGSRYHHQAHLCSAAVSRSKQGQKHLEGLAPPPVAATRAPVRHAPAHPPNKRPAPFQYGQCSCQMCRLPVQRTKPPLYDANQGTCATRPAVGKRHTGLAGLHHVSDTPESFEAFWLDFLRMYHTGEPMQDPNAGWAHCWASQSPVQALHPRGARRLGTNSCRCFYRGAGAALPRGCRDVVPHARAPARSI